MGPSPPCSITNVKVKYLGVTISIHPKEYVLYNLLPLLQKCISQSKVQNMLPISVAGCTNLLKIIWMPQLMYYLHNSPCWIPHKYF